jgi:hypothetical protein
MKYHALPDANEGGPRTESQSRNASLSLVPLILLIKLTPKSFTWSFEPLHNTRSS